MTSATKATVSATAVTTNIAAGGPEFSKWNFDFADAAGTKAPTQSGDGVTVTSAVFDVSTAAAGPAIFTITAVDVNGAPMTEVAPLVFTETLPFSLPATTFPAPTAGGVSFS
jgi:hypothetical protein